MKKKVLALALVMLLTLLMPLTAAAVDLPEEVEYYDGNAYKIYIMSVSWTEAKEYCEELGGHLAAITSSGEQGFIESLNSDSSRLWIGGYRDDDFNWFWVTGEPWDYTNWSSGEPNDSSNVVSNENSVALWPKQWNDLNENNKSEQRGFICEWELDKPQKPDFVVSNWAKDEVGQAYDEGLIPEVLVGKDLTQKISRAEFAALSVRLYEELTGAKTSPAGLTNPFTDVSGSSCYNDILTAYMLGITNGTGTTTFSPDEFISREQLATMLCRTIKKYSHPEWTLETDSEYYLDTSGTRVFADDADISAWAKPSVYFMAKFNIVNGIDATHFAPKAVNTEQQASGYATATREQAVALSLRIFRLADVWKQQ